MRDLWNQPKYMQKGQNTMYILTKEEWDAIPNDYKIDDRPEPWRLRREEGEPRQVFAAFLVENGGTTLLTEGKHFAIK